MSNIYGTSMPFVLIFPVLQSTFPQTQGLRRTRICYLSFHYQGCGQGLARSHQSETKCQLGIQSHLKLGAVFQDHPGFAEFILCKVQSSAPHYLAGCSPQVTFNSYRRDSGPRHVTLPQQHSTRLQSQKRISVSKKSSVHL